VAAGRAVAGVLPRTFLAALCFGTFGPGAFAAAPKAPEARRLALRVPDTFPLGPIERFTAAARQHGVEVQNAPEGLPVPKGWEVAHLWILPVDDRWKAQLARFPVSFEGKAFVFEAKTYAGKDDAIFLADPSRPGESFIVAGSDQEALDLAQRRLVLRDARPADYEAVSGELTKEGRFVARDGRLAVDASTDRDGIAARDAFFRDLKHEKRGSVDWEFAAADSAAVDRWEKAAAKFAGKRPFAVRVFPDTVTKALYTGSSRPADVVTEGKAVRVEIDASAPEEPDLITPALAAASIAAANPSLLGRPTLLMAVGARRYGRWWGRETKSFSALVHAAGVEPSIDDVLKSPEDVSPVLAVGAAAAWLDAGARLESEALVEKALAEPEAALAKKLSSWRDAAWRQAVKPPERRALPSGFLRGVSYAMSNAIEGAYIAPVSLTTLRRLKELSANSISVMPYGFARDPAAEKILFVHHSARGETDEALVRAVADARSLGMTALVKPQLWIGTGAPVGEIAMPDERAWRAWFDSYRRFVVHAAIVAEASGAALFCVGSELRASETREKEWRDVVAAVRLATGGPLVYASNGAAGAARITFWDVLDAIGVDFYDPLSKSEKLSDSALEDAIRKAAQPLADLAQRAGRPVIFTEAGYPAVRGAWIAPHDEGAPRQAGGEDAARAIAAIPRVLGKESWWKGVYWWKAPSDGKPAAAGERGFNVLGMPAEKAIADGFRRMPSP
jgi:hypothetical protein